MIPSTSWQIRRGEDLHVTCVATSPPTEVALDANDAPAEVACVKTDTAVPPEKVMI
jgi:hypothetical protein